jgi:hypothetical protein
MKIKPINKEQVRIILKESNIKIDDLAMDLYWRLVAEGTSKAKARRIARQIYRSLTDDN